MDDAAGLRAIQYVATSCLPYRDIVAHTVSITSQRTLGVHGFRCRSDADRFYTISGASLASPQYGYHRPGLYLP